MTKNIENLLKDRYQLIADYPLCPFNVNDIIYNKFKNIYGTDETNQVMTIKDIEKYPHLFKKLDWFEEQNIDEMIEKTMTFQQIIEENYKSIIKRGLITEKTDVKDFLNKIYEEVEEMEFEIPKENFLGIENAYVVSENLWFELSDIILTCLNLARHYNIDIESYLTKKIQINYERAKK